VRFLARCGAPGSAGDPKGEFAWLLRGLEERMEEGGLALWREQGKGAAQARPPAARRPPAHSRRARFVRGGVGQVLAELAGLGAGSDDAAPAFAAATLAMARCALQRGIEGSMRSERSPRAETCAACALTH
jgi:hypothetical protein